MNRFHFLFLLLLPLFGATSDHRKTPVRPGGKDYALFFAVEKYDHAAAWNPLPGLIKECEAIRDDLVEHYGFSTDSKVFPNPTLTDIHEEIERWREKKYEADDQLLIFFSGHGQFVKFIDGLGEGFFIPRDGKSSQAKVAERNWYSLLQMPRHINGIGCRHILLAIDACYSGTIDPQVALKDETEEWETPVSVADAQFNAYVHDRLAGKSRILMTSGGKFRTKHPSDFVRWFREALATLGGKDRLVMPHDIEERWPTRTADRPLAGTFEGHEPGGTFLFVYQPKTTLPVAAEDYDDDGVPDGQDKCPYEKGPAATKGCPDTDGDGVADKFDKCKNEKGPAENDGCPVPIDTDGDGIANAADKCPDEYGLAATEGCPDADDDGVADKFDRCKNEKGPANNEGCPEHHASLDMVFVQGGTFRMGCTDEQQDCDADEKPAHDITVSNFYIGKYEVTQKLWTDIMGSNPAYFNNCDQCPVEQVSWEAIQEFLKKLNAKYIGKNYRLPTEAEWEYAAQGGGRATLFGNGKNVANPAEINFDGDWEVKPYSVKGVDRSKTIPVGGLNQPNALGLHDMSGNVWEWCSDWYAADYYQNSPLKDPKGPVSGLSRVLRGGSWGFNPQQCRVSYRGDGAPDSRGNDCGFRVVSSYP